MPCWWAGGRGGPVADAHRPGERGHRDRRGRLRHPAGADRRVDRGAAAAHGARARRPGLPAAGVEVRRAQRPVAGGGAAAGLHVRGRLPAGDGHEGPQPGHRVVLGASTASGRRYATRLDAWLDPSNFDAAGSGSARRLAATDHSATWVKTVYMPRRRDLHPRSRSGGGPPRRTARTTTSCRMPCPPPAPSSGAGVLAGGDDVPGGGVESFGDARGGDARLGGRMWSCCAPWSACAVVGVQVAHDEQRPAGSDPRREPVVELELRHRRVGVVRRHQVVGPGGFPRAQVGPHPLDPVVHALRGRPVDRSRQGLGGDVDRRDLPPCPAEPDRLGALAEPASSAVPGVRPRPRPAGTGSAGLVSGAEPAPPLVVAVPVRLVELVGVGSPCGGWSTWVAVTASGVIGP